MLRGVRFRTLAPALALAVAIACRQEPDAPAADAAAAPAATAKAAAPADPAPKDPKPAHKHVRSPQERPLPAFSGWTLDDQRFEVSNLLGQRLLLFFFNPEVKDSAVVAKTLQPIAALRSKHNFQMVGIATGSTRARAAEFAKSQGFDFPVVDDSNAAIAGKLGLRVPLALLGVDAEGYVTFGLGQFAVDAPGAAEAIEEQIREALRLPTQADENAPGLANQPPAPGFRAPQLYAKEDFDLAAQRGRPLILTFFLHTCPHCHELLGFLKEYLPKLPEDKRPQLVGLEISGRTDSVRQQLRTDGFDFFPVVFDPDGKIQAAYGVFAGVPDIFLIDAEGRIVNRTSGWERAQHEPLLKMRIAKLAGAPVPMLLRSKGYSGNEVCGVCHELEHETWTYTQHASAFDTLVTHAADADPECIGCHVVGYNEPGGFKTARETPELEDVGCESCHGRGGPHLSPDFVKNGNYQTACGTCHDPTHSLGFEYASFLPRISHAANAAILKLPPDQKRERLAALGARRKDVLPTNAVYVGSEACRGCHAPEHETWSRSPHAQAVETLAAVHKQGNPDCLRCHTTGFGRPGGFPEKASPTQHPDLAAVGCESCHGPGGDHIAEGAAKIGSIVSLGDKCDSCVILQICGACHDEANDPGFEFEVKEKIEKQRHGTLEPGTGKPKGKTALESPRGIEERLAAVFAGLDAAR
jgi:peroxiredoxin/nitrate/TMAO reductase-like tetraheme cytochrome c subunit